MNIKKIEDVILLMEKHGLTEISIEDEGVKLHLRKGLGSAIENTIQMQPPMPSAPPPAVPAEIKKEPANFVEIKAPMVGTFYRSPSPDTKPFVDIGSKVTEGDVLCIIEAMKLMNEIKSEVKGKIIDILVENGDPVEFGQIVFHIEPA